MARGGSRGRRTSYVRDNSGRFASTPGGGPPKRSTPASRRAARAKVTGGTLGARSSLRRSRAKLAGKNPADRSLRGSLSLRAQKGAVTRGANRLGKVRAASTVRMAGKGPAGVIRGGRKVAAKPVAAQPKLAATKRISSPRPSGTLAKPRNLKPGAIAARKANAAPVKPPRTRKAATAGKTASAAATKAERVLARVASNAAKSQKAGRGRKQELRKARSAAVADLARIFLQGLAVGKNDPNVQYPRQQLLGTLNNSLKRPLPKTQRRSTTKKSKEESLSDKSYRNWYANMIDIQRRKKKRQPKP